MFNQDIRNLFVYWYLKGVSEGEWYDGIKFFYFYLCFNIIMANLSNENSDRRMLNWIESNDNVLKDSFTQRLEYKAFLEQVNYLQRLCPVIDSRQNADREVTITDPRNFTEIVEVVYQVRCNFFHGNKPIGIHRNQELIKTCSLLLKYWLEQVIYLTQMDVNV